jgi:hypothetical protein
MASSGGRPARRLPSPVNTAGLFLFNEFIVEIKRACDYPRAVGQVSRLPQFPRFFYRVKCCKVKFNELGSYFRLVGPQAVAGETPALR